MTKQDLIRKLTSRKFWVAVAGFVSGLIVAFEGDAGTAAAELARRGLRPDVICVDPPRKGLAPEVIESVVLMRPKRIVYVSCDPATLGRDVKRFDAYGYRAVRAAAVDLFPRTANIETVCLLEREKKKN